MATTDIFAGIDNSKDPKHLLNLLADCFREHGFGAVCYVLPRALPGNFRIFQRGLPEAWFARYMAEDMGLIDPIPGHVIRNGKVDTFTNILAEIDGSLKEQEFIREFYQSGIGDGLAIPTCAVHCAQGFCGVVTISDDDLARVDRSLMHAIAQHGYERFVDFQSGDGTDVAHLSPREKEILQWLAMGKSNPDIATILNISVPTVATHLKRLFLKLNVSDRVSAALKGMKLGVVTV